MPPSKHAASLMRKSLDGLQMVAADSPLIVGTSAVTGKNEWTFRDMATGDLLFATSRYQVASAFVLGYVNAWRRREPPAAPPPLPHAPSGDTGE